MTIRTPTIADADDLGEIHVEAWQAAYRRGLMPDAYLDALTVEARARMWRAMLAGDPGPAVTRLVSERDGHLAGFVVVGPCRDDGGIAEVHALNVRPRAWGEGHGRDLLSAGLNALVNAGFTEAVLWVHPRNQRARRFYELAGWRADDAFRHAEILRVVTPEIRYRRPLQPSAGPAAPGR